MKDLTEDASSSVLKLEIFCCSLKGWSELRYSYSTEFIVTELVLSLFTCSTSSHNISIKFINCIIGNLVVTFSALLTKIAYREFVYNVDTDLIFFNSLLALFELKCKLCKGRLYQFTYSNLLHFIQNVFF